MNHNKILWTGGWDSTYRLLDLVLIKKKLVQPYYILDHNRPSTKMELSIMEDIKSLIFEMDSSAKERILDTEIIDSTRIPENKVITSMFKNILDVSYIGSQYEWLGSYAYSEGLNNLELCIHLDDKAQIVIKNDVEKIEVENDSFYKVVNNPSNPNLKLFSFYHFPILNMTKLDMDKMAKENGFSHIMEKTWFCHNPYKGKPCGMCNPCIYTKEEGLGRRVPDPTIFMKVNRKFIGKIRGFKKKITLSTTRGD